VYSVNQDDVIQCVQQWLNQVVIGHNFCPFAKKELVSDRIRYFVSSAEKEKNLLEDLGAELELLNRDQSIETTLLVMPNILKNFQDYNQFLNYADDLIQELDLHGVYQIASFHPNYQFSNTAPSDVENYTNRSPYPILHLLREESLEKAIASYPNVDDIPSQNIKRLRGLGETELNKLILHCTPVDESGN